MKEKLKLVIKGFVIGIANIIPGVSGGTLAITLGIYEDLINAISHFFTNFKKNLEFLILLGIGAVLSILTLSKLINFSLTKFPVPTTLFFIGLIVGGVPLIYKNVKGNKLNIKYAISFIIPFALIMAITFMDSGNKAISLANMNVLKMIVLGLIGIVAAATMVIPGISGSFVLMLLGYYKPIVKTISDLTNFKLLAHNLMVLIPFGLGVLLGIVLVAKIVEYLLKKHEKITYYAILGFIISSIISLIVNLFSYSTTIYQLLASIVLLGIGMAIGYKLGDE